MGIYKKFSPHNGFEERICGKLVYSIGENTIKKPSCFGIMSPFNDKSIPVIIVNNSNYIHKNYCNIVGFQSVIYSICFLKRSFTGIYFT